MVDTLPDKAEHVMRLLDEAFISINSRRVFDHAARTLGYFLRVGGPLTADLADKQVPSPVPCTATITTCHDDSEACVALALLTTAARLV